MSEQNRLEINWVNSAGAALAAVSSAVVLSTLGTAGTLIGAAMGSLVITVGGAIYAHSLRAARARLAAAQALTARRKARAQETRSVDVEDRGTGAYATTEAEEASPSGSRWQVLRELPWKRIVIASAAVFAVAMAAILAFELATGRPVSSYTGGTSDTGGGTSVPGIGGRDAPAGDAPGGDAPDGSPGDQEEAPEQEEQDSVPPPEEQGPAPVEEETVAPAPTAPPAPQETAP